MSREALNDGLTRLGLALSEAQIDQLIDYLALLQKWNRVYNLTAVRDPAEMLTHHLLDSLAAIGPLRRQAAGRPLRVLDVGSGGGLPGVVIAIACPDMDVTCVDTVGKKAAFIQQAAAALGLGHLRGLHARVETLRADPEDDRGGDGFDLICSRAFASLSDFTAWSCAALREGGVWMAMKGKHPAEEIAALPPEVTVFHVEPLVVPGLDAERCIVWLRPSTA